MAWWHRCKFTVFHAILFERTLTFFKLEEDFQGDWVAAAHSIGAGILSAKHGVPSNLTYNSVGYEQFTTPEVVQRAHQLGMKVIPWTVDHEVTIDAMISADVDGIISNYPERQTPSCLSLTHEYCLPCADLLEQVWPG